MGSWNSKLNPEGEAVPAKIRPIVRRWFDEIRRRKDQNQSKKELLIDGAEEDAVSQRKSLNEKDRKSSSSSSEFVACPETPPAEDEKPNAAHVPAESDKTIKEPRANKDEEKSEKRDKKDGTRKEDKEEKMVDKAVVVEEVVVVLGETKDEEEENEEEEVDDEEEIDKATYITPGSPSFRVYCTPTSENRREGSKDESEHKNTTRVDSVKSNSNEGRQTQTKKRGNRGRRLTRAICKSGPLAVKNLLNVTSCYHPGCAGNDRARLLAEKAEG